VKDYELQHIEALKQRIATLEALLREVQTQWWAGCAPMMERIGAALSGARTAEPHGDAND